MKKIPLFPIYFKWIGLALMLIAVLQYVYYALFSEIPIDFNVEMFVIMSNQPLNEPVYFSTTTVDFGLTMWLLVLLLGLTCIAFSRTKSEDEMIKSIRLYSWTWSIFIMIGLGIFITLFFYGWSFLTFATLFGHILLTLFIIIFYMNYFSLAGKGIQDEE